MKTPEEETIKFYEDAISNFGLHLLILKMQDKITPEDTISFWEYCERFWRACSKRRMDYCEVDEYCNCDPCSEYPTHGNPPICYRCDREKMREKLNEPADFS